MMRLEFELIYYDVAAKHLSQYTSGIPPNRLENINN